MGPEEKYQWKGRILNWRCAYLQQIRKFRETGKPILYMDKNWVDANLMFRRCWQNKEVVGMTTNLNASNRLIVVHLGRSGDFVEGCELVYKAGKATGGYHGQINSDNFEKWVSDKVIPNWQLRLSSSWTMRPTTKSKLIDLRPSHL
jgi:hypothetical protein